MWTFIRDLMDQFDEAIVVLDSAGELAVINAAARDQLALEPSLNKIEGLRMLRVNAERDHDLAQPVLDEAAAQLPVILAIRNRDRYLYISPAHETIFREDPAPFFRNAFEFLNRVHPEDLPTVRGCFEADLSGAPQQYQCRVRRADGEWRRLQVKVRPFFDHASGEVLVASLTEDISSSKLTQRPDPVQPLPGTAEFRRQIDKALTQWTSVRGGPFFAVALLDIARFRTVNDSFGYRRGDQLLEVVSLRIQQALPARSRVAGFGADRFAILLRGIEEGPQAEEIINQVLLAISAPVALEENTISVNARAGLALPRGMDCTADMLLRDADTALQLAKRQRDSLVVAELDRSAPALDLATLEFDLNRALDGDEFYFEFQPVFEPQEGKVLLLEALLRWRHPRLGIISPASFISVAEDSGLVLRLDMQGLERLERQIEYWRSIDPRIAEIPLSINISGRHFPNFVMEKQFHRLLRRPALKSSRIIFEITESVFVDSNPRTAAGLERLREAGVEIWLDDFGEGYSSFRYVAHFPVDGIKISESFVKHCAREEKSRVILTSMQTLARGLGVHTVVEGVENREQFETLRTMGFDALQGYYLSPPLGVKEIPKLFAERGLASRHSA